ncbi:hypothetical protein L210DRAFT_3642059 [Boletus edulis BED1]|uniref:Uncharacterized protein n=1 Tax=Boletus edulis BED1 TaxID=1328754 RepID=A0AAD4GJ80_BOLED|nr:hypothetical protein L210DRAFT_3642059 [Boletus edulis BED1]
MRCLPYKAAVHQCPAFCPPSSLPVKRVIALAKVAVRQTPSLLPTSGEASTAQPDIQSRARLLLAGYAASLHASSSYTTGIAAHAPPGKSGSHPRRRALRALAHPLPLSSIRSLSASRTERRPKTESSVCLRPKGTF